MSPTSSDKPLTIDAQTFCNVTGLERRTTLAIVHKYAEELYTQAEWERLVGITPAKKK